MTRLVFVTQQVDPASPVLGATVAKVKSLAARVDELVVLADSAVPGVLPGNCRVRLFRSRAKLGRGLRFETALARELRPRPVAVVAHMCPIYAVLAAPAARPLGVPVLLWFTHWKQSRLLRLAERCSNAVITVDRRSFPLASDKVVPIGHGIDLHDLPFVTRPARDRLELLALGRTSPAKGLATIVEGVSAVPGARLRIVGPSLTAEERLYRDELIALAARRGSDEVSIEQAVPRSGVPALLAEVDALVNNMRAGATDKVVYEAAATGLPVLASNPALDELLPDELRFPRDDPAALAERIAWLTTADREAIGRELRARVERDHDVEGWAERVLEVARTA